MRKAQRTKIVGFLSLHAFDKTEFMREILVNLNGPVITVYYGAQGRYLLNQKTIALMGH